MREIKVYKLVKKVGRYPEVTAGDFNRHCANEQFI
jgi:hypothetical protein